MRRSSLQKERANLLPKRVLDDGTSFCCNKASSFQKTKDFQNPFLKDSEITDRIINGKTDPKRDE